ncbi:MAG: uracil-DNA glycosylase family protein [Planctomycetota bacterium]
MRTLVDAARELSSTLRQFDFADPVTHVYNPLEYAWKSHCKFLKKASKATEVILLGMNPGPWGMAQTGVPFGEISAVRDWLGIEENVQRPEQEHPKRPIEGFNCSRSEVSGRRLWGLFSERFDSADQFFERHFVVNYCPLVFMESSGRNRTPDKLPAGERQPLDEACDKHLHRVLRTLSPRHAVGVGAYAEACLKRVIENSKLEGIAISRILHPSPASPAANKDWAGTVKKQLSESGVW